MTSQHTRRPIREEPSPADSAEQADRVAAPSQRMDAIAGLAGVVSHDFSNLLTVILGHADILLDVCGDNQAMRSSALEIRNAAESGARVAGDLLAISQRQALSPTPVDINGIVRRLTETLCQILGEQIDIRMDLAAELPLVSVDVTQYERVLRAIAVHSREVMPEGGRLTISTCVERRAASTDVVLRATDTAALVTPRSAEPIFTGKKPSRGAGLALTTAHGIIEQSGGRFTVTQPVGRGATITVMLPARDGGGFLPRT